MHADLQTYSCNEPYIIRTKNIMVLWDIFKHEPRVANCSGTCGVPPQFHEISAMHMKLNFPENSIHWNKHFPIYISNETENFNFF